MNWYAVQDSDWDWNSADGAAAIVLAETPEEAVRMVLETDWAGDADGGHLKVAELSLAGFVGFDVADGVVTIEEFQPHDNKPLQGRALTLAYMHGGAATSVSATDSDA